MPAKQAIKISVVDEDKDDTIEMPAKKIKKTVKVAKVSNTDVSKIVKTVEKTEKTTAKKSAGRLKKVTVPEKSEEKSVKKPVKAAKTTTIAKTVKTAKTTKISKTGKTVKAGKGKSEKPVKKEAVKVTDVVAKEAVKETPVEPAVVKEEEKKEEKPAGESAPVIPEVKTMKKLDSSMKEEVLRKIDDANKPAPAVITPMPAEETATVTAAPVEVPKAKTTDIESAGGAVKETVAQLTKTDEAKKSAPDDDDILKKVNHKHSIKIYKKIAYSFIFLTLIMLAVVAYFTFVKVTIVLIPNQERLSNNLIFDIYDKDKGTSIPENAITGVVKTVEISDMKNYPSSGSETIGENVTGKVTIINNYTKAQPLVATTRLLSADGKLFRLKDTVNAPAGGSIEAEVYADQPTKDMSVPPTKFTIPGLWAGMQSQIYAESKEEIKYQQQVKKHVVQTDIDNAIVQMKQDILAKAKTDINNQYKDYKQILYKIDDNTITYKANAKNGDEKDEFGVEMKADVVVVAFNEERTSALAQMKFTESLPATKELIAFDKDNIIYSLNNFDLSQGTANITGTFEGKISLKEGSSIVDVNKIMGLNKGQLDAYLSGLPDIAGFEVRYYPSFIKRVPNLVDKIKVEVKK